MPMFPVICYNNEGHSNPFHLLHHHFGLGLDIDKLLLPFEVRMKKHTPMRCQSTNAANECSSTSAEDKFQVNLDIQHFSPEEVTVKVDGKNTITVEGKHEEKQDEHGFISRQFIRRYVLPDGHDIDNVASSLSSDGVLSITAPRLNQEISNNRTIPIQKIRTPDIPVVNEKHN